MMTGKGRINEWRVVYGFLDAEYRGYIADENENYIAVPEASAHQLCDLLNGLLDSLAEIADRFDTYKTIDARSLCEFAYDELVKHGQIVRDNNANRE